MVNTSASAQIAAAVKATLDGYDLPRISTEPTILTVKEFTIKLCQMAAAVESDNAGGRFGHMHLILTEKEYRIATKNSTATITTLTKPPEVNPEFKALKKEELTKYKVLQLEAETKQAITAYITQEETAKELVRRMVASIETEYIEALDNEYTGYNNETPKSILAHLATEYCKATITDQLSAESDFAKPWDQVTNLGTWITRLEILRRKCEEVGVEINDGRMVLKITENAKKCALFTDIDHELYDKLPDHALDTVTKFWVKKYKAHTKYIRAQTSANDYESAAYTGHPHNVAGSSNDDNETYISALEEAVTRLTTEKESAFAATKATGSTPSTDLGKSMLHDFKQQLLTDVKNEMTKILAAATAAATAGAETPTGTSTGTIKGRGRGRTKGSDLPVCPHCGKNGRHKPEDCFSLPANAGKKPANFIDGKYVTEKKAE